MENWEEFVSYNEYVSTAYERSDGFGLCWTLKCVNRIFRSSLLPIFIFIFASLNIPTFLNTSHPSSIKRNKIFRNIATASKCLLPFWKVLRHVVVALQVLCGKSSLYLLRTYRIYLLRWQILKCTCKCCDLFLIISCPLTNKPFRSCCFSK